MICYSKKSNNNRKSEEEKLMQVRKHVMSEKKACSWFEKYDEKQEIVADSDDDNMNKSVRNEGILIAI